MTVLESVKRLTPSELKQLHRAIGERVGGVTDYYTGRGSHEGCGECCSRMLPMTDGEVEVLRRAVRERGIRLRPERAEIDFTCPLLGEDSRCMAYDVRPIICRQYCCAEHAQGLVMMHPLMSRLEVRDLREELRCESR